ncbi:3-deoxy-D-manno-octulosonic acid transferase [Ruficoccus amylovorans]|uniref:3-deoxy-D-manno-octulosonic acid transferase n=1 Tax=Ruficoccus amylovorans TaxID=1804625 RepID=A0A842HDX9_9BACT|nr:3-deoxy-D-manno-octulosonic acid transferase [Ruficoccus amylovorans]MBC2594439.1 3-deoxy-D-manno-octulosonic acid transferase [Ruficoccus amylovorans]
MIWFYRLLFLPALLIALPYYWWRMYKRGGYRHDFHHRFGLIDRPPAKRPGTKRIWIQAVSVGEIRALTPLVDALHELPGVEVIVTTTTSTGYKILREEFSPKVLKVGIFPLDFFPFSRNSWRRLEPDLAILMEAELWPEHLYQAHLRGVPVLLINGRMSDRSFQRYKKFPAVSRRLMGRLAGLLAATPNDGQRFLALGTDPATTAVTGSMKLDVEVKPVLSPEEIAALHHEMGFTAPEASQPIPLVLLGSSTWPGEEALLLDILNDALAAGIDTRLLIIPRHAERRGEIIELLNKQPLPWHLRTRSKQAPGPVKIYVADTTGEMLRLSQAGTLAFIGKSVPPNDGGQTPVEAAALGLPLVYGPGMSNFRHICRQLEEAGAALRQPDAPAVKATLLELMRDPARREKMSAAGRAWHAANQGATARIVERVRQEIGK